MLHEAAIFVLARLPTIVSDRLLTDAEFVKRTGVGTKNTITLGPGLEFEREALVRAVNGAIEVGVGNSVPATLEDGDVCAVEFLDDPTPRVVLVKGEQRSGNVLVVFLAHRADVRSRALAEIQNVFQLKAEILGRWRGIITERALDTTELEQLRLDLDDSFLGFLMRANDLFRRGKFSSHDLVPSTEVYFHQLLLGLPSSEPNFETFILEHWRVLTRSVLTERPNDLHLLLALAGSAELADVRGLEVNDQALLNNFDVGDLADPFSVIAGLHICLERLSSHSEYTERAMKLVANVVNDGLNDMCVAFAGAYALSYTAVANHSYFRNKPLYFRRMAVFAHASICVRMVDEAGLSTREFGEWALQTEGAGFLWTALLDKREAPRWRPMWLEPRQLMCEVLGRLRQLGHLYPAESEKIGLPLAIEELERRLKVHGLGWAELYPGPLEGSWLSNQPALPLQPEQIAVIKDSIDNAMGLERCLGIVVVSPLWNVPDDLLNEATKEVDRSSLPGDEKGRNLFRNVLEGLAHLAGLKRSARLAELVAAMAVRACTASSDPLALSDMLAAVVECSAAFPDRNEQIEWISNTLTRFAFVVRSKDDAGALLKALNALGENDGLATLRLSRARAATEAFLRAA